MNNKKIFTRLIIEWWSKNKRDYPWRKTKDPYRILVTEMLLRKTTATQVNSLYNKFFSEYPDICSLSKANKKKLKETIASLGLYNQRSEQLLKISKIICNEYNGSIPNNYNKLLDLPGVGRYVAGAVMCQSYGKTEAMVDTNIIRVTGRFFNYQSGKKEPYTDSKLWDFTKTLIPKSKCKALNLGIIDFANAVCLPKNPKCFECLLSENCKFNSTND